MTREEAIEKVRKWNLPKETREILEALAPELRESEDERIRKEIVGVIQKHYPNTPESYRWISWLEKQKEPKPILEVFGFKVGDAVRLKDGDGRKHIIKSFEEVEGVHGPNFYHVEFEDNSARDGIYPGEEYPNGYYTQMEKFEEVQKPVEWSEEDEKMLDDIIRSLPRMAMGNIEMLPSVAEQYANRLKSLRPSRKSSEVCYGAKGDPDPAGVWKPSEEQVQALEYVIRDYREDSCNATANYLQEILDHLKNM